MKGNFLSFLPLISDAQSKRSSSYDRRGGNADFIRIDAHETVRIADINGAGCINHIWITAMSKDIYYLRSMLLRMYWDGEPDPSVDTPLGDFFGLGHGIPTQFISIPLSVVGTAPSLLDSDFNKAALNCFFPMPFAKSARVEIMNESDIPCSKFYYHVDYETWSKMPRNLGRFHAKWRRENPTQAQKTDVNITGKENYTILEAQGQGHYVGCVLAIENLSTSWFGEGDDMIFIDGENFPPSLHGTGLEDYFCSAWGFPGEYSGPYHGVSLAGDLRDSTGKWTMYRFHLVDPIRFKKSIKVTIEHGHANKRSDDYSSVAYWYQTEPHKNFFQMPNPRERRPSWKGVLEEGV